MGIFNCAVIGCLLFSLIQSIHAYKYNVTARSVTINGSTIVGRLSRLLEDDRPVYEYVGIPYAKAPTGKLRFQKPVPFAKYPKKVKAYIDPPGCLQYTTLPYPWYPKSEDKKEDCLFLNIWVPYHSLTSYIPVMFYIYGGEHRYGSITHEMYNGTYHLPGSFEGSNSGLWDLLEALKWVHTNIFYFGGDSNNITLTGQGSGAVDVGLLSISPLARGLFARHIMQSGSPAYMLAENNTQNLAYSQELAKYFNCANDSYTIDKNPKQVVKCLRRITDYKIARAQYYLALKVQHHLMPQWGDEILPENPRLVIAKGDFNCTDLFIGSNRDEGTIALAAYEYSNHFGFFGNNWGPVNRALGQDIIRKAVRAFPDPDSIVDYYLPEDMENDTNHQIRTQVYTALGDIEITCPVMYYAEKCAEQGKRVYYYHYYIKPYKWIWAEWMGTTNFDEVTYVFGVPFLAFFPVQHYAADKLTSYWTRFMKNGNISEPFEYTNWPLFTKEDRNYKPMGPDTISALDILSSIPSEKNCDFLRSKFGF